MSAIAALAKRYPLEVFFVLAYAITWAMFPLILVNRLFGLLGLFGPAAAAIIVTALAEGRRESGNCSTAWSNGGWASPGIWWP